jgi:hypothetical protein
MPFFIGFLIFLVHKYPCRHGVGLIRPCTFMKGQGFPCCNPQLYTMLSHQLIHMSSSETQPNDAEETKKDEAVLSQIGEDPGLSPDTIEQDSKAMDHKRNRQGKDIDRTKTKDSDLHNSIS